MEKSLSIFDRLINLLSTMFCCLFGRFSWSSPPWMKSIGKQVHPPFRSHSWGILGTVIVLFIAILVSCGWYYLRPQIPLVVAQITPPSLMLNEENATPTPLTIDFGMNTNDEFFPTSAAPLEYLGHSILKGIELSPPIPGIWQWQSDSRLVFTPTQNWLAGQLYRVVFQKDVFANHIQMASYQHQFSTLPFAIEITELKFYQDLKDPHLRKIVGTLNFNFPVDENSLFQRTRLVLQAIKNERLDLAAQSYPLTVTFDKSQRTAYLESGPLTLPAIPRYVNLVIDSGVQAKYGSSKTVKALKQKLLLPDATRFLKIANVKVGIERDEQGQPFQVLILETTVGIKQTDLIKYLHVSSLPKDCPATLFHPIRKDFAWSKIGEVTPEILELATPIELQPLAEEHPYPTTQRFKFHAATPNALYIQISKGLPSFGDFSLAKEYTIIQQAPEYPREIRFLHAGSLMALSGEKKLTLSVRGIPEIKLSIAQVLQQHTHHLISQTKGDFRNPLFLHASFGPEAITQIFTEHRQFNSVHPGDLQYTSLDLETYLEKQVSRVGLLLIKAQGWNSEKKVATGEEITRLILITDMNLLIKDHADGAHDVFVQSITEGTPIENAQVKVIGKNGLPIVSATTDADGHVYFPSLANFGEERAPTFYLVHKKEDFSLIPYQRSDRELNFSRFSTGGISYLPDNQISAYLFSERGIYRPGEMMHIGCIVRNPLMADLPFGLPLEIVITDPRRMNVLKQKVVLPVSNFFTIDYPLSASALTGEYQIKLYIVKDQHQENLLGFQSIQVGEFLPDRLKMEAKLDSPMIQKAKQKLHWISPHELKAKVSLWNLFGMPATHCRIKGRMILAPQPLYFSQYGDYHFADPSLDASKPMKTFTENLTETATDEEGNAEFHLNLERFAKATYQLFFFAEGFEAEGGRAVSADTSLLITPAKYLVGYKPDHDLQFLKQNHLHQVHFVALDSEIHTIPLQDLQVQIMAIKNRSTLVKKPDGTYQYQSIKQEIPVHHSSFEISEKGSYFSLPTTAIGNFALILRDAEGNPLTKCLFSIVGEAEASVLKDAELTLKLNKKIYQPGESIEVQIMAPYTGAGLITIERDKVYAYQWFKTDSPTSIQKIQLPSDFRGTGYLNVTFVRAWDSKEIFMNPLSYAVAPFEISHEEQTVQVNLHTPTWIRAGENLPIEVSTDQPAQIVLFAVDEGILQISNYQTPDPLAHFFCKRALNVKTQQIADLILPKYQANREHSATGGDGGLKLLAMHLNPFKRKNESPVVFWSGIIDVDSTSRIIHYPLPSYFNGSLKIMAVAVAPQAAGSASKSTKVQDHFIIQPQVPTFVAPGDTFFVTANITKSLLNDQEKESDKTILIQLAASPSCGVVGSAQESLLIPAGEQRTVTFQIKAKGNCGNASLTFVATQGEKTSKREATLSIRPPCAYQTTLTTGSSTSVHQVIPQDRQFYPEHSVLQASASFNPVMLAEGLQNYLDDYPHDCTEQMISKAFTYLTLANHPLFRVGEKERQIKLSQTIQMLRERQTYQGGFSYWPGQQGSHAHLMATIYAVDYLTEAKSWGYPVPADLFEAAIHYLENIVQKEPDSLSEARLQAYAIYLLTRNEIVTTNDLTNLQLYLTAHHKENWHQDVTSAYLAATYHLLRNGKEAEFLINQYRLHPSNIEGSSDFYNSLIGDAQYLILLSRHFPKRLKKIDGNVILQFTKGIAIDQLNTLSAAYSIQALAAIDHTPSAVNLLPLQISQGFADKQEKGLTSSHPLYEKVNVDRQAQSIHFHNPSKHTYFYQIQQSGFDLHLPKHPLKQGMEIFREYRNHEKQEIQSIKRGDKVEVHVKGRSLTSSFISHVAIVDLLPGGFEVVPKSIQAEGCDYFDVREDRIIFYCSFTTKITEFKYQLQAVNLGNYLVPPIFAQSMYREKLKAQGMNQHIQVFP